MVKENNNIIDDFSEEDKAEINQNFWKLEENPENERTVAQALAYSAVINAKNKLDYLKEVTDRSEGKALQKVEMEGNLSVQISKLESIIDDLITEDTEDPEIN